MGFDLSTNQPSHSGRLSRSRRSKKRRSAVLRASRADEERGEPSRLVLEEMLDDGARIAHPSVSSTFESVSRTSTTLPSSTTGHPFAVSIACSSDSHATITYPPTTSFASA